MPAIYRRIEEDLRSRYLLAYQSSSSLDPESFRRVVVEVEDPDRPGRKLEVRAPSGYYP